MAKLARTKAEQQFAASQKKQEKFLKEKEKALQVRTAKIARLRALRLAKAAGNEGELKPADEKVSDTTEQTGNPPTLPKGHPRQS